MTTSNGTSNNSRSGNSGNSSGSSGSSSNASGSGRGQTVPPNPSIWVLENDFFASASEGKRTYIQLIAMNGVWVDPKTYKTAENGEADPIKCTKMNLFDSADRHQVARILANLPACGIPLDKSDKKTPYEAAKGYRPWTAAPLVMRLVLQVEQDVRFNNMKVKFNLVAGTMLMNRSAKVTIHGDDSWEPIVIAVFGATCCLTIAKASDESESEDEKDGEDKDEKVLVTSGSLVCVGAAAMRHAPLTVVVAPPGGSSVVLVMRYVGQSWTRSQLEAFIEEAECKKKKQAKAQYAKLMCNGSLEEEEEVGGNVNVQGDGVADDADDDDDDDDDMGGVAKKRKVKL